MDLKHMKELLILSKEALKERKDNMPHGLCALWSAICSENWITARENSALRQYLEDNAPEYIKKKLHNSPIMLKYYFWEEGNWRPRKMWLTKEINRLDKLEKLFK